MLALLLPSLAAAASEVTPLGVAELRGRLFGPSERPRVVNFWATWCGPCVAELPRLVTYAKAHPEVEVVLVDLDIASLRDSKVEPFLEQHGVVGTTLLQLDDPDPAMAIRELIPDWSDVVPLTLFVTAQGVVNGRVTGVLSDADLAAPRFDPQGGSAPPVPPVDPQGGSAPPVPPVDPQGGSAARVPPGDPTSGSAPPVPPLR